MQLPNPDRAVADINKLRNYCLDPTHSKGKHKARVFAAALDLTIDNAEELRDILLNAVQIYDAKPTQQDEYGQYYVIDFIITRGEKRALVRSSWIVRIDEDFPRLTSCYVL